MSTGARPPYRILDGTANLRVVEIGMANGDTLAHLAGRYPQHRFTGIDFSIKSASRHSAPNLEFRVGYALDELEAGRLSGDVFFAASVFCYVGPVEMQSYAKAIRGAGFKHVVISDPRSKVWNAQDYPGRSMYLHKGICGHDYGNLFAEKRFRADSYRNVIYTGHRRLSQIRMQVYAGYRS